MSEHIQAIRALLAGETVSLAGNYVRLDGVRLDHPPAVVPSVLAGVRGPRSLELSGRVADGTVLAWPLTGAYLAQAHAAIDRGRRAADRTDRHWLVAGTPISVDPDPAQARDVLRVAIAVELAGPTGHIHIEPLGIDAEVTRLLAACRTIERFAAELSDQWIDQLVIAGAIGHCVERIAALTDQSIDCLLLSFPATVPADEQDRIGRQIIAAVRS